MIVGAGISGLCAGYEPKRRGFEVHILERPPRVGGRIITFREPFFAPGLDAEGGAMRIPENHLLVHQYLENFGLNDKLVDFEMKNKFIHLSGYDGGKTLATAEFERKFDGRRSRGRLIEAVPPSQQRGKEENS